LFIKDFCSLYHVKLQYTTRDSLISVHQNMTFSQHHSSLGGAYIAPLSSTQQPSYSEYV